MQTEWVPGTTYAIFVYWTCSGLDIVACFVFVVVSVVVVLVFVLILAVVVVVVVLPLRSPTGPALETIYL